MTANNTAEKKPNVLDLFAEGARRGLSIGTKSLMPNVIMAFVLIRVLDATGILQWIGKVFAPVMALWGLPGEAATVILTSVMSMGGGIGIAVSLYVGQHLDAAQVTMLLPAVYLMGNPVQNVGRCLGTSGVNTKHYMAILAICVINTMVSIWAMRLLMIFF